MNDRLIWQRSHQIYENNKILHRSLLENVYRYISHILFRFNRKYLWRKIEFSNKSGTDPISFEQQKISIIIPIYGDSPTLLKCLDSISESLGILPEVIVVDNGVPKDVAEKVLNHQINVNYIKNKKNTGFGAACETGIDTAKNDFILLLNSDVIVRDDCIATLIKEVKNNLSIGCCSPVLINKFDRIEEAGRVLTSNGDSYPILAGIKSSKIPESGIWAVPYASFACTLIKKSVFKKTNGFDPAYYPAYSEDVDLSLELSKMGFKNYVSFKARAFHVQGESSELIPDLLDIKIRNMEYSSNKYSEYFTKLPLKIEANKYPFDLYASWHQSETTRRLYVVDANFDFREYFENYNTNINQEEFVQIICVDPLKGKLINFSFEDINYFLKRNISPIHYGIDSLAEYIYDFIGIFENVYISKDLKNRIKKSLLTKLEISQIEAKFNEIYC